MDTEIFRDQFGLPHRMVDCSCGIDHQAEFEEEVRLCEEGLCDHYTCTEGQSLAEWEYNNRGL